MTLVYLYSELIVHIFTDFFAYPLHCIVNRFVAFARQLCNLGIFPACKVFFEYLALHTAEKAAVLVRKQCRQCILHKTASGLLVYIASERFLKHTSIVFVNRHIQRYRIVGYLLLQLLYLLCRQS